ncbi:MAG: hypothetical protein ACRD8W_31450 [Nitrososphaeraceae archaeon]
MDKSVKIAAVSLLAAAALIVTASTAINGGIPFPSVLAACTGSGDSHTDITQEPNVDSAVATLPSGQIAGQAST